MSELKAMASVLAEEHEAMLQFLYMAPIGLVQMRIDGEILMINPLGAQLLMPLSRDGELANLFTVLQTVAPDLAYRARNFEPMHAMVCDSMHLQVDSGVPGVKDPQVLSLRLLRLDDERLMAVLDDISLSEKRDRQLRHSQAWIHAIVTGITDYALLSLDRLGMVQGWNAGVMKLTGFAADAVVGHSYAQFYPQDDERGFRAMERLLDADRSGWNLEEGWLPRANGERYWGSCLIAPLHKPGETATEERAYSLIIRDISEHRDANEALRRSISCDLLTGLANRRAFFQSDTTAMGRRAGTQLPMSAVAFEADNFKSVNDIHGHAGFAPSAMSTRRRGSR